MILNGANRVGQAPHLKEPDWFSRRVPIVRDLKAHQAILLPMVSEFGGRIIDTAGDGILAEFASVVKALECAVAIQKTMAERTAAVDQVRRMQWRIGVNIGDVIFDEARIYGEGINVAARLDGSTGAR